MITIEIKATTAEINSLIDFLGTNAQFNEIRAQVMSSRDQRQHHQEDEVPKEGDNEYIERSE